MSKSFMAVILLVASFFMGSIVGSGKAYSRGLEEGRNQYKIVQQEMVYESIVENITYCESRDIHDRTSWAGAYGRAQFMERTFNWMKGLAGKENLEWRNEEDQMWLLNWAIRKGYGSHWQTCYRQAVAKTTEKIAYIKF